jgi:hypothetical protein
MCYVVDVVPASSTGSVSVTFTPQVGDSRAFLASWGVSGQAGICVTVPVGTYDVVASLVDGELDPIASNQIELVVSKKTPTAGIWYTPQEASKSLWVVGYVDGVTVIPTGNATLYEVVDGERVPIGTAPLVYTGTYAIADASVKLPPRPPGSYSFEIDFSGSEELEPATGSGSITVEPDSTGGPVSNAPTWFISTGHALDNGRGRIRLQWSGTGVDHFEVAQSVDGGPFLTFLSQAAPWNTERLVLPGHTYQFRVRGFDDVGNAGAWATGPVSRFSAVSERSALVRYAGRWSNATSTSSFWGGTARYSTTAGSTASYTFTGRAITWVGVAGRTRGAARVYIDGQLKATINLWLPTTRTKYMIWQQTWSAPATHTITIKVVGTAGRPRVDVDGFIVGT